MSKRTLPIGAVMAVAALSGPAQAAKFTTGIADVEGSWVTNLTGGLGIRAQSPSCSLTGDPNANGCGISANTAQWANGDDGNLNYKEGQRFTTYVSATSELFLNSKQAGLKFLMRGTGLYDFAADDTQRTELSSEAKRQIVHNAELLDLWIQKDFVLGKRRAHVRGGKQVINWGESLYALGGISATNSLDYQKYSTPGTQLKQILLPAPMLNFGAEVADGLSLEGYYQFRWNRNRFAPVGSYWSAGDVYGRGSQPAAIDGTNFNIGGRDAASYAQEGRPGRVDIDTLNSTWAAFPSTATSFPFPYETVKPDRHGQFGAKLGWTPDTLPATFAFYFIQYTDKNPVLTYGATASQWSFLSNRRLFGISTNFGLGDWSIGAELSYRPRDAIALSGCFTPGGETDAVTNGAVVPGAGCAAYRDTKKTQLVVNGQLFLRKSNSGLIDLLGGDLGVLTLEGTWINYKGVNKDARYDSVQNGTAVYQVPAAGYVTFLQTGSNGYPILAPQGSANSGGLTMDFNVTYDNTLISGWQVTPGIFMQASVAGYTPTYAYNYAQGYKSANAYLYFTQNPANWQIGLNYAKFFGGNPTTNFYSDRDFVGAFVTRNF